MQVAAKRLHLFWVCGEDISEVPGLICYNRWVLSEGHKNYFLSVVELFLTKWIISKECNPDNFESHDSLKPSVTNICGLCSNFVERGSFQESNSPDILALSEKNLDDSINSDHYLVLYIMRLF